MQEIVVDFTSRELHNDLLLRSLWSHPLDFNRPLQHNTRDQSTVKEKQIQAYPLRVEGVLPHCLLQSSIETLYRDAENAEEMAINRRLASAHAGLEQQMKRRRRASLAVTTKDYKTLRQEGELFNRSVMGAVSVSCSPAQAQPASVPFFRNGCIPTKRAFVRQNATISEEDMDDTFGREVDSVYQRKYSAPQRRMSASAA